MEGHAMEGRAVEGHAVVHDNKSGTLVLQDEYY